MVAWSIVAVLALAAPQDDRCPSPPARNPSDLAAGAAECHLLSVALRGVAGMCFAGGRYLGDSQGCKDAVAECERRRDATQEHQDTYHQNGPYLNDITGGWLGQSYPVQNKGIFDDWDASYDCESRDMAALLRASVQREGISTRHQRIEDEWIAWHAWAVRVAQDCRAGVAKEDERKREDAQRREREEQERRAEEERRRAEAEREARARRETQQHARDKDQIDRSHAQLAGALAGMSGAGEFTGGIARSAHFRFGADVGSAPIYGDMTSAGSFIGSTDATGLGLGPYLRVDLFPLFAKYLGLGVFGEVAAGGAATGAATSYYLHYDVGPRAFVGRDDLVALELDWSTGSRTGSWDSYNASTDTGTKGVGSASYRGMGIGGHVCFGARGDQCEELAYLRIGRERVSAAGATDSVVRIGFTKRGGYDAFVEWGPGYPRLGTPSQPIAQTTGTTLEVALSYAWDVFAPWQ